MNLLVTGGAGFIGSVLVRQVLGTGLLDGEKIDQVIVLDAFTYAGHRENLATVSGHPRLTIIEGDIADAGAVERVFRERGITGVIHLAAESHVDRSIDDAAPFLRTNVEGTFRLLEAAQKAWGQGTTNRFLHVSTDEVYGARSPDDSPATEATPYAPRSPYAASKAAGDHLALAFHHTYGLPVVVCQSSNNYGPHQFPEKLIPLTLLNALEGKPLPIYGDGGQKRDWLHVEDHVRGLGAAFLRGRPGERYLLGSEVETENLGLVRELCALLDQRRPRPAGSHADLIRHVQDRPGHDRRYAVDAAKARRDLGWKSQIDLKTGLALTVDWYLAHLDWCELVTKGRYDRERLGLGSP